MNRVHSFGSDKSANNRGRQLRVAVAWEKIYILIYRETLTFLALSYSATFKTMDQSFVIRNVYQ